jgi:hypothetical protein
MWLGRLALPAIILLAFTAGAVVHTAAAADDVTYVEATGHSLRGVFRAFWQQNGGVDNFGWPITEEYIDPQSGRVVQYYERARFERVSATSADVRLGPLGREYLGERTFPPVGQALSAPARRYIPEARQVIQYGFKTIWETRGGRAIFGLPLSGEVRETTDDGVLRTVQYFENARFEYHPEQPDGRRVLITQLGRRMAPAQLLPRVAPNALPAAPLTIVAPSATPRRTIVPPGENATITPLAGTPGERFTLQAIGFQPGERVSIWTNRRGESARVIGQYTADDRGMLMGIAFAAATNAPEGEWAVVAQGVTSGNTAVAYYLLQRTAVGRLPTATPTPPPPTATPSPLPTATPGPPVPRSVDARAEPPAGPAGTTFFFDASGFRAGEDVIVAIIASDGAQIGADFSVKADARGSIGYAGIFYISRAGAPLGLYRMVAYGQSSNKTSTAYFVLTP